MNNSKHILFIVPGFPKDEEDFYCIPPLQEFLEKFMIIYPGVDFSVIAFHYPFSEKRYKWNGINTTPLNGKNSKIKKPVLWLRAIQEARKINHSCPVDVIHSLWLGECALIGKIISQIFKCSHICTLMGQDVKGSNKYLRILKNKEIKIVALSKNQSDQYYNLTKREVDDIIHWGIDDQPSSGTGRDIDMLAVGSLIPLKNYSLFVKSVAEVKKTESDVKAILVGDGAEFSNLKRMAIEAGIENNIEFKGLMKRRDIFNLMQKSRLFVHPSLFEGSGYVFAEALANGMNIISFNVGYAQENPRWFIANDEEEFISKTKSLIRSKLDFTPENLFPLRDTVNRYASLYGIN